jgi:triphosphoribosyl-dephospho-CoA synthase
MVVQDFIKSAEAASKVIAEDNITVGKRILQAVQATWDAVNCNTNLGIILLSAPIIQAALNKTEGDLERKLHEILSSLTVDDAVQCFQAIAIAKPAGLGKLEQHDVSMNPEITLIEAMTIAAPRDIIALQYQTGFADLFSIGLPIYEQGCNRWLQPAWATTLLYLSYLARWPDSHIIRKHGEDAAFTVLSEAGFHYHRLMQYDNPKKYLPQLLGFDSSLKARHLNPGSTADLTVATILLSSTIGYK